MYLFETMRLDAGKICREPYHFQRLFQASQSLNMPFSKRDWEQLVHDIQAQVDEGIYRLKVILESDGTLHFSYQPLASVQGMTARMVMLPPEIPQWCRTHKTSERAFLQHHHETDLILLYDENDKILEFDIGNVVLEHDGQYYTPQFDHDFLKGCMRQSLIDQGVIQPCLISRDTLRRALSNNGRLWLINSLRAWVPVTLIE